MKKLTLLCVCLFSLVACSSQSSKMTKELNLSLKHPSAACEAIKLNYNEGYVSLGNQEHHKLMIRLSELGYFNKTEKTQAQDSYFIPKGTIRSVSLVSVN